MASSGIPVGDHKEPWLCIRHPTGRKIDHIIHFSGVSGFSGMLCFTEWRLACFHYLPCDSWYVYRAKICKNPKDCWRSVAVMCWALEPCRQWCHKIRTSTDQKDFHHWKLWNSASRFPSLKVMEMLKDIHHWKLWMEIAKVSSQLELNFRSQAHKTAVQSQKLI